MVNVNLRLENFNLVVEIQNMNEAENYTYAYYFFKDDIVDKKIWYSDNLTAMHSISENGVYKVTTFIKEKDNDTAKPTTITTEAFRFFRGRKPSLLPFVKIEEMEMTNYCNLSCQNCCTPTTKYPKGFIEDGTVLATLAWTQKGQTLNYHRQGEPLLHKQLDKYIRWGVEAEIKPVISTNGLLLTEDKLKSLYQSGLRHMEITLHTSKSIKAFIMACNYFKKNNIKVYNFSQHYKQFEEDVMFFTGKILDFPNDCAQGKDIAEELVNIQNEYKDYLQTHKTHTWAGNVPGTQKNFNEDIIQQRQKKCYFIQRHIVNIRWDGTVVGCCFDSENHNEIGHVRDFSNIKIELERYNLCEHCDTNWATRS